METFLYFAAWWFISCFSLGLMYSFAFNREFTFIVVWYDGWVGYYWDKKNKNLYVFPFPYIGYKITMGSPFKFSFKIVEK